MNQHRLGHYELQWMAGKFGQLPVKVHACTPLITAGNVVGVKMVFKTLAFPKIDTWSRTTIDTVTQVTTEDRNGEMPAFVLEHDGNAKFRVPRKIFKLLKRQARLEAGKQVVRYRRGYTNRHAENQAYVPPTF